MSFNTLWKYYTELGIGPDTSLDLKLKIKITNKVAIFTAAAAFVYFIIFMIFFPTSIKDRSLFIAYHLFNVVGLLPVLWLNKKGFYTIASLLFIIIIYILTTYNSYLLAEPFRTEPYLFVVAAFSFIIFSNIKIIIPIFAVLTATYFFLIYRILGAIPSFQSVTDGLHIRVTLYFGMLFAVMYTLRKEHIRKRLELSNQALALAETNDQLQKLNYTKDKIFSIKSHDLKSPIGSLKGLLNLLKDKRITAEEFKKATSGLEKQVNQLYQSLDEMLIWSKSQLHGLTPKPDTIELRNLIHEIVTVNKLAARSKKIILTLSVPNDLSVYCDFNMLKSVVHNLISNAIKFTNERGAVSVHGYSMNGQTYIVIEDTGVGISDEDILKILDKNVHYTTYGTNNEKGTGLGVIMCKDFVEKNNGQFLIKSEPGKGTSIEINLPSTKE